ncbi:MAG: GNAT family N-acetyltransferase [Myxococcota bacterium]
MVPIDTQRLHIRAFVEGDLEQVHHILTDAFGAASEDAEEAMDDRRAWLRWQIDSARWLERMKRPPYGDRAVVWRATGEVVGVVGFVPLLAPFGQLPGFDDITDTPGITQAELGLFWVIAREHRGRGLATESARAMISHAFDVLRLARVLAMTRHDNAPSVAVMRKLRMRMFTHYGEPGWLQVVGVLKNPEAR